MLLQMVAVDQFIQIVGGFGVVFVNMGNFRVGFPVDQVIEEVGDGHAKCDGTHHDQQTHIGLHSLGYQVKADHAEHHATGKAQQQTHDPVGILLQQRTHKAAQTGAGYTGQCSGDDQSRNNTHSIPSFVSIG